MSKTKTRLVELEALKRAADCLRTLSHPHRLRMVEMLLRRECTVGQLAEGCDIRSHVTSEHLRRMKDRGLLACRRDGRRVYYRVADEGLSDILDCVKSRFGGARSG